MVPNDIDGGNKEDREEGSMEQLMGMSETEDSEWESRRKLTWSIVIRVSYMLYR